LNLFAKPAPTLLRLPTGSFTVDCSGRVLTATLPSNFPCALVDDIARLVLQTFREASAAQLPFYELTIDYSTLKITARELRGGAWVCLTPKTTSCQPNPG
jgi:hypothetical protein